MPIRLTPRARQDLEAIWTHGAAEWGAARADAYLIALSHLFDLIVEFPEMSPLRPEFTPPVRLHPHGAHLVVHLEDDLGVLIVRVIGNRQDLLAALDG
ncbi:type II toxin-antitoxin system RelE/ParE family toxin [Frigidibacter mobilis]|uniref:Plasmid stabilization system protein n=1 Tax=Frigidibacter mobilis TaxID=1335048 RepID=A0A159Z0N9_9RHOB|nr:type II toxin-antitoxin system RelE/ParE family toxin [Frigidibacter mobilis]AMY67440.1 plasmid stabilization system protein [Frigidibacter mobilis]